MPDTKKVVMVDCATLSVLVDVTKAAEENLQSGLADGTYEQDAIAGHSGKAVAQALIVAEGLLS